MMSTIVGLLPILKSPIIFGKVLVLDTCLAYYMPTCVISRLSFLSIVGLQIKASLAADISCQYGHTTAAVLVVLWY